LGFNSYGYGCPDDLKDDLPYMESWNDLVPISLYRNDDTFRYVDIFDSIVQESIETKVRNKCIANRNNPNLIGYMWTDLPTWTLENKHNTNWVDFCRQLPDSAPGKIEYVQYLQAQYDSDIDSFNELYLTGMGDWESLLSYSFASVPDKSEIRNDDLAFLRMIARQYYTLLGNATREYDPSHLVFGDRLLFSLVVDEVIEEMLPHVDAIAIQPNYNAGFPDETYQHLHSLTNKPILICDYAIRFPEEGKDINNVTAPDQETAGKDYNDYLQEAISTS
ncbi:unnamed protein product, partial [marine sediment metagenome]